MSSEEKTSKSATVVFWLVAMVLVVGLALWKVMPKRAQAASSQCYARMSTLGSLVKAYAGKHDGQRPTDYDDFRDVAPSAAPKSWVCPSDQSNPMANETDWAAFVPAHASYDLFPQDKDDGKSDQILIRCRIHGHVVYYSGNAAKAK
jgi:hypothetical protein